jgi:hypothetical protein
LKVLTPQLGSAAGAGGGMRILSHQVPEMELQATATEMQVGRLGCSCWCLVFGVWWFFLGGVLVRSGCVGVQQDPEMELQATATEMQVGGVGGVVVWCVVGREGGVGAIQGVLVGWLWWCAEGTCCTPAHPLRQHTLHWRHCFTGGGCDANHIQRGSLRQPGYCSDPDSVNRREC